MTDVFQSEHATPVQMVKAAIHLVSAYHDAQIERLSGILNGENPEELNHLIDRYQVMLEMNETSDEAFAALMTYLSDD